MKKKEIKISKGKYITIPAELSNCNGNLLLIGELDGFFGEFDTNGNLEADGNLWETNLALLFNALYNENSQIFIVTPQNAYEYMQQVINYLVDVNLVNWKVIEKTVKPIMVSEENGQASYEDYFSEKLINYCKKNDMKFDTIIQNPPYKKSLHLDFLEKGLELLSDNGKMIIIEPATWLINLRKNGKAKRYDIIKEKLKGHIVSVKVENYNKEFGITNPVPFAITTIDMNNYYPTIEFTCCGEKKVVDNIYDCNLIGSYCTIWNILNKVSNNCDVMRKHMTKKDMGNGYWYAKCIGFGSDSLISGSGGAFCAATTERAGMKYESEVLWSKTKNGEYLVPFTSIAFHYYHNGIQKEPHCGYDAGKHLTDKITNNVYGTKEELENWKHFIFNNKLPLFINICLTDNQHNNSTNNIPWLVDKQYTDDEINKMFGFTNEEIELINKTIKKYERNSPWFKRYMCGPDSISDEEVNNFIKNL